MPLTPNNKIDRKPCRNQTKLGLSLSKALLALPHNEMEADLARKWAGLLQLEQVGIDDTFFDLGGNSLLSIQLIAQLEQEMQIQIPVVKFYQYPTIRLFSQYLHQSQEQTPSLDSSAERALRQRQAMAKLRQRSSKRQ